MPVEIERVEVYYDENPEFAKNHLYSHGFKILLKKPIIVKGQKTKKLYFLDLPLIAGSAFIYKACVHTDRTQKLIDVYGAKKVGDKIFIMGGVKIKEETSSQKILRRPE